MPQLDFTTYSSQIFWFLICFIVLFTVTSKIILPRIAEIIKNRQDLINADLQSSQELQAELEQLNGQTEEIRKKANGTYKIKIEEVNKEASANRQKLIEKVKTDIENTTKESRAKIQNFVKEIDAKAQKSTQDLIKQIRDKLIS